MKNPHLPPSAEVRTIISHAFRTASHDVTLSIRTNLRTAGTQPFQITFSNPLLSKSLYLSKGLGNMERGTARLSPSLLSLDIYLEYCIGGLHGGGPPRLDMSPYMRRHFSEYAKAIDHICEGKDPGKYPKTVKRGKGGQFLFPYSQGL